MAAYKNKDEFFDAIKDIIGDDTSEKALSFLENMTDTYAAFEETGNDARVAELEKELKDTNEAWSKRYKERFFSGGRVNAFSDNEDDEEDPEARAEEIRIDDLFEDEEPEPKDKPDAE